MDLTPPVSRNGFEYFNNDFYAVVPPSNRHRRSTIPELRDLFSLSNSGSGSGSANDKPAHWYRAQLMHYGLQPTSNKGTASLRLLEALRGGLSVPDDLKKLEGDLKKEWQKNVRASKKQSQPKNAVQYKPKPKQEGKKAATKLKAAVSEAVKPHLELDVLGIGAAASASTNNMDLSVSNVNINYYAETKPKSAAAKPKSTEKPTQARKSGKSAATAKPKKEAVPKNVAAKSAGPRKCTAPKTPKQEEQQDIPQRSQQTNPWRTGPTLGLLNGSYKIDADSVETRNSGMILCLEKDSIWGEFQLGPIEGVFFMRDRPWEVSVSGHGGCTFEWRGVDSMDGYTYVDPLCWGEMRFLGDGLVEGTFYNCIPDLDEGQNACDFWGNRISGKNETKAPRDAWSIRDEFFSLQP
ncbi:hypothetical protein BDV18DRAFT_141218 [Aspergillus unguis]